MVMDVADIDEFIRVNELQEITTANIFKGTASQPHPEGLGSYDIFGNPGTRERKMKFAYINLHADFIHPLVFDTLCFLKPQLKEALVGIGEFYLKNGKLIKVTTRNPPPPGVKTGTGAKWFKKNLNNFVFEKPGMSSVVKDRCVFIKSLKPTEMFCNKWLVIPPYYRDIDLSSGNKKNDINIMYQNLMAQASMIHSSMNLFGGEDAPTDAYRKIQLKLNELYLYFMDFQTGTKKFMQQHILGKAIDYAAHMVVSTPTIRAQNSSAMEVDFSHSAVPLDMVLKCFAPFIVFGLRRFINGKIGGSNYVYSYKEGKLDRIELASHWNSILLSDNIKKLIELYANSKERRLEPLMIPTADGGEVSLGYMVADRSKTIVGGNDLAGAEPPGKIRPLTLCEIFYIVAQQTIADKSIFITRYPVEDYHNIYPSLMNIIPYYKTGKVSVDGIEYPRFPLISKEDMETGEAISKFVDTVRVFPTYLSSLGMDFDGDKISLQGVFSNNSGSKEYIYSKTNVINIGGGTMRGLGDISTHTIYALTRKKV
jgi:hypothetical protein